MPNKAGDRVKTDRRDAKPLDRVLRSGCLSPGSVPAGAAAASRALRWAREDILRALTAAKMRLTAFFLRHAIRSTGRSHWSPAPRRWRSEVGWPTPAPYKGQQA